MAAARLNPVHRKVAGDRQHYEWSWAEAVRRPRRVYWEAEGRRWQRLYWEAVGRRLFVWVGWRAQ